jgi:SAM-dependent methyltransferase
VVRWAPLVAAGGTVLDVAAGQGRHASYLAARGHVVTAIDRDEAALRALPASIEVVVADLESGPWPLPGRSFDAVVVTNYLWRPLLPHLVAALPPGGVLLYETFARGNETVGRPSRPAFLLEPGELLRAAGGLRIVAYEDGFLTAPDRFVQRLAAVRPSGSEPAVRYPLDASGG